MPHTRVAQQRDAIGYDFYFVFGADAAVGCSSVGTAQTVRGRVVNPVPHLTRPPGSVYRVGRRVLAPSGESSVVIVPPDGEFTSSSPLGPPLSIKIDQSALIEELKSRRASSRDAWALRLEMLTLA